MSELLKVSGNVRITIKVSGDIGTTNYYQNLVEILKLTKLSGDVSAKKTYRNYCHR